MPPGMNALVFPRKYACDVFSRKGGEWRMRAVRRKEHLCM